MTPRFRLVSSLEFLLGALVVVGHNVYRVVPNEVPILVVAGLLSFQLRDGGWAALGLGRPISWRRTLLVAVAAAALRIAVGSFVIEPLAALVWPPIAAPAGAKTIAGNLPRALLALLFVWAFAAFGEEIAYRGFLLTRAADLGRRSPAAHWCAASVVAVLFGIGHYFKGPAGVVDSGVAGLILAAAFLLTGRNLWAPILAHGLIDTLAVASIYFGWE